MPINLNKLTQEDELHIYDVYRADLQTHKEFTLGVKRQKARWELYPTDQVNPGHLCEALELVNKNWFPEYLLYVEHFAYNATLYSNKRKIFKRFEIFKDIFTLHNGTGHT